MQKLVFLMQEESNDAASRLPDTYTYVPYDYGPFARELYDDLDRLKAKEVIEEDPAEMADGASKYDYRLGENADEYLRDISDQKLERTLEIARRIKSGFNNEELPSLIDYVCDILPRLKTRASYPVSAGQVNPDDWESMVCDRRRWLCHETVTPTTVTDWS